MKKTVLVRYGEIALKSGPVRSKFENTLIENMAKTLKEGPEFSIRTERGRIYVDTSDPDRVARKLSYLPGIVSTSPVWETDAETERILDTSEKVAEKEFTPDGKFAVDARRTGQHDFTSKDLEEIVGEMLLKKFPGLEVDLDEPQQTLHIEIRKSKAFVFTDIFDGLGGLPVGTQGRTVSLVYDSYKSSICSYLMMKRGALTHPVFFLPSGGDVNRKDIIEVSRKMLKFHPEMEIRIIPLKLVSKEIPKGLSPTLRWIFCKRLIIKIGESIAKKIKAKALVSDERLKELANSKIANIKLLEEKLEFPVFRPLVGVSNKMQEEIAERISVSKSDQNAFSICPSVTKNPEKINPSRIHEIEKSIDMEKLIKSTLESMETIKLEG